MNATQFANWLVQRHSTVPTQWMKPLIMGVLNVTSDSFSDGGYFLSENRAFDQAMQLINEGADILDVGGESTRPYASPVSCDLELSRVIPVITRIRACSDVCISIDSYKPLVMKQATLAGANIINDVYALQQEGALEMAAQLGVPVCLMHMQGHPGSMQDAVDYPQGVLVAVSNFFAQRLNACRLAGICETNIILDPGFGFGKRVCDNLELVHHLETFHELRAPMLLGVSRKSTIGAILNKEVHERLIGGITLGVYAALKGVGIIRTHDVAETKQSLDVLEAMQGVHQKNQQEVY